MTLLVTFNPEAMASEEVQLFENLLKKSEKYLTPCGIWPTENNSWITLFNIVVLFVYSIMVLIKNLLDPERESIENAFTLANGGLITVVYFVTIFIKREKVKELFAYIKSEKQAPATRVEKEATIAVGREYYKISTAFLVILPASVFVRFIQPPIEYFYIQFFRIDKSFSLPASMGIPTFLIGELPTYIVESLVRGLMLITLMGVCSIFILSTLTICNQFNILAIKLEHMQTDDSKEIDKLIAEHRDLLKIAKTLNDIYSPYFFADCAFSFVNLSIMLFSLIASNARLQTYLMEIPLVTAGMSQLFFVLYFGDRLIDAVINV
jgi:hypothetical protein